MVICLAGIGLWIGVTVLVTVINDDPSDPRPATLTFAAGGALFFGCIFGYALLRTRPRRDPELDALLAELTTEPLQERASAAHINAMRRVARTYIVLGALVTALGLAAIVEEVLGIGSTAATLYATVAIVVVWALAVPLVIRRAQRASAAVLTPLSLGQNGSSLEGERHGRHVRIELTTAGSVTRVSDVPGAPELRGEEILAYAGRGEPETWRDATVAAEDGALVIRRRGHEGNAWLWDLWLAEHLAGGDRQIPGL